MFQDFSSITMKVFKGFLLRALNIWSKKYVGNEMEFLIIVFTENGLSIKVLEKATKEYINNINCVTEKKPQR